MRFLKIFPISIIVLLGATISSGAAPNDDKTNAKVNPVISMDSVEQYVDQTVTLNSEVINVRTIGARTMIVLEKRFSLVIDSTNALTFSNAGIDIQSLPGKLIKITGKVYKHPQFGLQIDLTNPSQIVVGKKHTKESLILQFQLKTFLHIQISMLW